MSPTTTPGWCSTTCSTRSTIAGSDHRYVPTAVFSRSAGRGVGLTEAGGPGRARRVTVTQDYGDVAYGWAMEDTDHFAKLIGEAAHG